MLRLALAIAAGALVVIATGAGATANAGSATTTFPGRNGSIIVASVRGEGFLVVDPVTGRYGSRTLPRRNWQVGDPAYSPDGREIAFTRIGLADLPVDGDVYVMAADGTAPRRVLRYARDPAWSPDGSRLAVTRGSALWVVRADGSRPRLLTGAGVVATDPAWSPDGRSVLFGGTALELPSGCCLYAVRLDRPEPEVVFDGRVGAAWPAVSPDGTLVARRDERGIAVGVAGGGTPHHLVAAPVDPAVNELTALFWSPDSRELAYVETTRQPAPGSLFPTSVLYRVEVATGRATRIGYVPPWQSLDWQPRCTLRGNARANRLRGTAGDDLVCGLAGGDTISGGAGSDRLFGEAGNDAILARDGRFGVVGCGAGRDVVRADPGDLVGIDCEHVVRPKRGATRLGSSAEATKPPSPRARIPTVWLD